MINYMLILTAPVSHQTLEGDDPVSTLEQKDAAIFIIVIAIVLHKESHNLKDKTPSI